MVAKFKNRIVEELREFSILAIYLFVCFAALNFFKSAVLQSQGVDFSPWVFSLVKALIVAKFMLVGRALRIGEGYTSHPLIFPTLHKSTAFLILLFVMLFIEELAVGALHGRTIHDTLSDFGGGTVQQMVATSIIMLLILIPYFAFRALGEVVGERVLVRLYFEPKANRG